MLLVFIVRFDAPHLTLATLNEDGTPHPIVVGGKEQKGDSVAIGIYKMEVTQKNLTTHNKAWVTAATLEGGPKGFRFAGTATVAGGKVIFTPDTAEVMI